MKIDSRFPSAILIIKRVSCSWPSLQDANVYLGRRLLYTLADVSSSCTSSLHMSFDIHTDWGPYDWSQYRERHLGCQERSLAVGHCAMWCPCFVYLSVILQSTHQKDSTWFAQSPADALHTLYDGMRSGDVTMAYEEALGLWASSSGTSSVFYSSPIWKEGIPSLYLYNGFIASFEDWSDRRPIYTFRGLLYDATQCDFERSGWPPALSQILYGQR